MSEETKARINSITGKIVEILLSWLVGGVIVYVSLSTDVSVLKSKYEALKDVPSEISAMTVKVDIIEKRLDKIESKLDRLIERRFSLHGAEDNR